jgi:5-formyltetrahydrofolate cyclo-ligase
MATAPPTKRELREVHLARRSARSDADQERLAQGLCDQVLALPEIARATHVAAFLSQDGEPGTAPLIDALGAAGIEVLIPILRDDFDLDWGRFEPGQQERGRFRLLVPTTPPLGEDAVARTEVVICPGVAVDLEGNRLGRGGGSYDRALSRCSERVLRVQLVYDDEVVDAVPAEPHDQRVDVIVTPTSTHRLRERG